MGVRKNNKDYKKIMDEKLKMIIESLNDQSPLELNVTCKISGITAGFYKAIKVAEDLFGMKVTEMENEIFEAGIHEMLKRIWTTYSIILQNAMNEDAHNDGKKH